MMEKGVQEKHWKCKKRKNMQTTCEERNKQETTWTTKKLLYDKSSNIMINHDDLDTITTKTKVKEQRVYAWQIHTHA